MSTDATAALSRSASPSRSSATRGRHLLLENYFYFLMTLLIFGIVVYGFSHTVDQNLFHPAVPRPFILYVHAAVFSDGWSCSCSSPRWSAATTCAGTAASGCSAQASAL
jgi:hypothetical protein